MGFFQLALANAPSSSDSAGFVAPTANSVLNGTGCGAQEITFTTCVKNSLFSPSTLVFAPDIATFCAPQQALGQLQLYTCICNVATLIVRCYNVNCPSDTTNFLTAQTYMTENCAAVKELSPTTTTALTPINTGSGFTNQSQPVLTIPGSNAAGATGASTTSSKSGAGGVKAGVVGVVGVLVAWWML
ncbi:hypothetical protein HDU98_003830 [Podochytrium sp. JEL0797]|nr:hypothetical protein HDU98_003830 [Podochytrium sp. JEL0797]